MEQKTGLPTKEDAANIIDVAEQLAILAGKLLKGDPFFALGALSLATAQVGVFVGIKYKDLIQLISDHYESAMLVEVEREFAEAGGEGFFVMKQTDCAPTGDKRTNNGKKDQ